MITELLVGMGRTMAEEVTRILDELFQDHRNMTLVLDLIERESLCIRDDSAADFDLLQDIMQYMAVYPDAVHHPKEDRLYEELKLAHPEWTGGFERISLDHHNIAEQGRKLRDAFAAVQSDALVNRERLADEALQYVNNLRNHMQWEELDLFERCRAMATQGHRFVTHDRVESKSDPLFGRSVHSAYERLFEHIKSARR